MKGDSTNEVAAEVSARESGVVYIGIEARRKLGVGYNDKVKVEIPDAGRVVKGSLNAGHHISVGKSVASELMDVGEEHQSATARVQGIVKKVSGTWDDDHELTEERHEKVPHLDSKDI